MGANSKIEWTHHTFNPWIGCTKVSAGCQHCYAENDTFARVQRGRGVELWGKDAHRHITSYSNWKKPEQWNREAKAAGKRHRVFCASLADVFEDRKDLEAARWRLFNLIEKTPNLDWLLLTKRPENMLKLLPTNWLIDPRPNVWLGATAENQEQADKRIPELLATSAAVRFLSCEPLLGPVSLTQWLESEYDRTARSWQVRGNEGRIKVDWVITGGESGHHARPMDEAWARDLRDQCNNAGVAFFMKQMGGAIDKRHDLDDLPADLRIRQFPEATQCPA